MKQNGKLRTDGVNRYCCSVLIKNKLNVEGNKWQFLIFATRRPHDSAARSADEHLVGLHLSSFNLRDGLHPARC